MCAKHTHTQTRLIRLIFNLALVAVSSALADFKPDPHDSGQFVAGRRTSLLTEYSAGKAAEDKRSLSPFSLVFISLSPSVSLPPSHVLHYTSYAKWGRAHCKQTQHKQMLCQGLAGAALMQPFTLKLGLVINKHRFFTVPLHNCSNYISLWFNLMTSWKLQIYTEAVERRLSATVVSF